MNCTSVTSCAECYTPENWNFPNITRPFSILYYVLGGTAFYSIDGEEHRFEQGHLYILPVNRQFSLWEDPQDKFYALYVHAYTSPEIEQVLTLRVQEDPFLFDLLQLMRRYAAQQKALPMQKLTDTLLSYIFELNTAADPSLPARIREYIDRHETEVFKRNELTRAFNYSDSHLTKIFKEHYDLTPRQYAKQRVLQRAVQLLSEGHSVAEIAEALRFSSPENFSRFFKNCYGCPPTAYLKHSKSFSP